MNKLRTETFICFPVRFGYSAGAQVLLRVAIPEKMSSGSKKMSGSDTRTSGIATRKRT
jgi:hypothetical protein